VRVRQIAAAAALFGAVSALSGPASAFCRTTTCRGCAPSADGCVAEGLPLYWPTACVSHSLQQDATKWASLDVATRAVDAAFTAWTTVTCPGTTAGPSLALVNIGPVACGAQEYNDGETTIGGNANIVVFNDDSWASVDTGADPEATLALTTVTYDKRNGAILDADIRVNGQNVLSTATPVPTNAYDLQSLISHEVGHFIGLSHSPAPCPAARACPTMRAVYPKGDDSFRTLEPDDVAGVCAVYPPGRNAPASCIPHYGFSGECGLAVKKSSGCQASPGPVPNSSACAAVLCAIAAWRKVRNRLREKRCPIPA
jgi:hypothetical protein